MRHTGIKIFLLLLFLVIILCAIIVIRDPSILPFGGEREQASSAGLFGGEGLKLPSIRQTQSTPAPMPEKTAEPSVVQQPAVEEEPAENVQPEQTPAPAAPTPTPFVPTPEPYSKVIGSGTISSGKPWLLNIHSDWTAVTVSETEAQVEVITYADHYALSYGSTESLRIRLGEESVLLSTNDIRAEINKPQSTELGRKTFTVPVRDGESVSLSLEVNWDFNGTYVDDAGHYFEIHGIPSEGTVSFRR